MTAVQRCGGIEAFTNQRCGRPQHNGDGLCDFAWSHFDSIQQTWTPPSKRPPPEPRRGRTRVTGGTFRRELSQWQIKRLERTHDYAIGQYGLYRRRGYGVEASFRYALAWARNRTEQRERRKAHGTGYTDRY